MKILRQGKVPGSEWFKEVCKYCKCKFAFQKNETRRRVSTPSDPRENGYSFLNCPTCKVRVYTTFNYPHHDQDES